MLEVRLKSKELLIIREAEKEDATNMINYVKKVGDQTDFLTFSSADFKTTKEEEEKLIEEHRQANNQIFLIALINQEIVGMLNVIASPKPRLRHIGDFGISVLKEYWNKGIGYHLMTYMINWAKDNPVIRKLNLSVYTQNASAVHLYEKMGFEREGLVTRASLVKGKFFDVYMMGMLFD